MADVLRNTTPYGRKVWNETDPGATVLYKAAQHLLSPLAPGTVQRAANRIIPALEGEKPLYGRELKPGSEIARELTGFYIENFNFKNAVVQWSAEFRDMERQAGEHFVETVSRKTKFTPDEMLDAYKEADQRRFHYWQEMRKNVLAAQRGGVDIDEINSAMIERNLGKTERLGVLEGVYAPLKLNKETIHKAEQMGRKVPIAEIEKFMTQRQGISLDR
jgi:hypothetical protein